MRGEYQILGEGSVCGRQVVAPRRGQALLEMVFILPFILILIMTVSEFGIYFYRANVVENTTQTAGRMAARGATSTELQSFLTSQMSRLSPSVTVKNSSGTTITSWSSDQQIEVTVTATASAVMPIGVLNTFGGKSNIFPSTFTFRSTRTVYVE